MRSNFLSWLPITLLLVGFYFYFFISSGGINTSNDGGHFALALAMYEDHDVEVGRFKDSFIRKPDYAVKDSIIYSDRLPGAAFLSLPFIAYADMMESVGLIDSIESGPGIPSDELKDYTLLIGASLMIQLCGVLGLLLLYLICRNVFEFPEVLSLVTVFICGAATLIHHESTHLFSHVPSMFLVTFAVYIAISKRWSISTRLLSAAVLIGASSVVELQNIIFFLPLGVYVLSSQFKKPIQIRSLPFTPMIGSLLILGSFLGVLLSYNHLAFGEWILKSNAFNPFFPEERHFLSALSGDPMDGLDKLFTSFSNIGGWMNWEQAVKNSTPGLLVANPVFLLSLIGFVPFFKKYRKEAILFCTLILISVLIAAFHVTTLTRHIFTIHILLFLPIVFVLDRIRGLSKSKLIFYSSIVLLIVIVSVKRELFINANYWGRDHLGQFPFLAYWREFFILNLPLLIIGPAMILRHKMSQRSSSNRRT